METYKKTGLLIERLKTYEIDNLKEVADRYPTTFKAIMHDLEKNRYWTNVTFDTVICMCDSFTLNGEKVDLIQFYKFFKQ